MTSVGAMWFAVTVLAFVALWLLSLRLHDVSIVDAMWGPAFALGPSVTLLLDGTVSPRRVLVLSLVWLWGLRLGLHLFIRNHGKPEDYRYAQMRAEHGARFGVRSLFTVFLLQAVLVWVIGWPLRAVFDANARGEITLSDWIATTVVLLGVIVESVADLQLAQFKRDALQRGRVMDRGLWRYSRHPNYFGDAVVWCGFGVFGLTDARGWDWLGALLGPLLMVFLLLRVSGVALLEQTIVTRRPAYADYIARTSAFILWPPKRDRS